MFLFEIKRQAKNVFPSDVERTVVLLNNNNCEKDVKSLGIILKRKAMKKSHRASFHNIISYCAMESILYIGTDKPE